MSIWEAFGISKYKGFSREAGQLLEKAVQLAGGMGCRKADTSHLLLVKAVPGRKPFIRKKENIQETASISIVPTVQGDAFPAVEKMGRLGSFRNAATGEAEPDSTSSAYAAFGKDKLHLLYVEKNVTATDAKKDFYADTVEFFLPTGGKYPVTQIAVNPNGEVRCNEWTIPVTSNTEDTAVKRIMKSVRLP